MNWLKQAADNPLFPDVLWSQPENRRYAGKLLIIGGHKQEFSAVSESYSAASQAGIGTTRVILPDSLQKMLGSLFPEAEYAASTPIGSFSRQALGTLLDAAAWGDGVLLAGDFGRNSETAVLLDSFIEKFQGMLALAGDSIDYFLNNPTRFTNRTNTLLLANLNQLQKMSLPSLVRQSADLAIVIGQISDWIAGTDLCLVTVHSKHAIAAHKDKISTTPVKLAALKASLAAYASVWLLQQPSKPFEALTTALYCYQ